MKRKYKVREITPIENRCTLVSCSGIYEVEELTPKANMCVSAACPAIYEAKDSKCALALSCPTIEEHESKYLIIGNELPSEENYDVVRVPTGILVNADKNRLRILREGSGQTDVAGRKVNLKSLPKEISFLEKKVGAGEILIRSGKLDR